MLVVRKARTDVVSKAGRSVADPQDKFVRAQNNRQAQAC